MNGCVQCLYIYIYFIYSCVLTYVSWGSRSAVEILWVWKHKSLRPIFQNINVRISCIHFMHAISLYLLLYRCFDHPFQFIPFHIWFSTTTTTFFFFFYFDHICQRIFNLRTLFFSFFSHICLRTCLSESISIGWAVNEVMLRFPVRFHKSGQHFQSFMIIFADSVG